MNKSTQKVKQKYLKLLNDLAKNSNSKVGEFDNWMNTAIGLNEAKNELYFVKQTKEKNTEISIKINQITKCKLQKQTKTIDNLDKKLVFINQVTLVVGQHNLTETNLEFYNSSTDNLSLSMELQLAEKWNKTIGDLMKQK
jgi:hypothetical protein